MEQPVTPVITPVVELVMGVVKKHLGFCFYSTNKVTDMHARIKRLNDTVRDIKKRKETNDANNLEVPHRVPDWLAEVGQICEEAGNIPSDGIGCFNMKTRYKAGKKSSDIIKKIGDLEVEQSRITWTNEERPLGRVPSTNASTSEPVAAAADDDDNCTQYGINSRYLIFKEALKSLDPKNARTQSIALCGMGGVGKSTMMEQLKKVAEDKKFFDWIVKVVIGKSENVIAIQKTIAEYTGKPLNETQKDTRAERLRKRFVGMSEDGKKNILVILDDLWDEVDLKDIGLTNPLPKGFKLLLTSREENVCIRMGVEASSIFRMVVLDEVEAKFLFWEIAGTVSDGNIDHDLHKIGEDIVKKCGGLPIAIKTIASTLKDNNIKDAWVHALFRLQNRKFPILDEIFKISYDNLKDDDEKATFLLSGLFPDDYNIPTEELMRYGWGLKFFQNANSITTARHQVNTCVNNLIRSNMLIEGDRKGCVKMHDLVRDFVLRNFSNVKQASLVDNDDISEQLTEESYERILLKCTDMSEFPADFNHPNLALLKLLDGDNLDTFPEDFYDRMEKLEVVAYDRIRQPLLPRYSISLRTLCLRSCRSVGDISFIGDLVNLEVLSFAFCGISKLPSAIGNLRKLKLLDLTECYGLCIDDGVFHKLEKLRELYMRAYKGKPIRFTEDSCEGLKLLSCKLIALDVEFFESIIQPKKLSFEKLERFRISMGCQLMYFENDVYKNTLKLVISCKELLESRINELFEKTETLELSVNEMSSLEQISVHPSQHSFCNLRDLCVYRCADLTSIFTVNVASSLTKLESLRVSECPVLESLVQEGENSEAKVIKFHKLKHLELDDLPMFVSFCDTDQVMELPQLGELTLLRHPNFTSIISENNEIPVAADEDDDGTQTGLKSRDLIFKEAMKSLDPNNKIQKIALCGMGGVGKTTMMDQLKKAVEGNNVFHWIVKVVIGKSQNLIAIQQGVAEYIGQPLTETQKDTRAERLRKSFVGMSEDGKKNILVILDDIWELVDLKDIGLTNPLPKGFKLLLTSREENVCTRMGVEACSIFRIAVLEEPEAKKLFWEIAGRVSDGDIDREICNIGEDIVRKCGGLPIAIKTIASTLKDNNIKDAWKDALSRLQNKNFLFLDEIFKISYDNLKNDDEKATFLLIGLFPDDNNIPTENLMRYGWGLKFFQNVNSITAARHRVNTCVNNLICSNLLIKSDDEGCVKMHDLVRDFVLTNFSNVKQASLVNSDDISEQLTKESYERILLKCTGMSEFPADFNHPNLALLKLLDGDNLDTFPEDFYDRMEKLEVVAYDRIRQPLLPRYSISLRTLCLRSCRSVGDISFIGDLVNLEVLSFAFCGISKLPSAIGNLKKLKLLDLTECVDLCIDDGVFHKLEKLRELYMRASGWKPIRFTEDSCEGLKMLSSKLIALDVEFSGSIIQPKNLSFEKLERFRISMGCQFENSDNDEYALKNTLKLVVSCKEVLECKINELFEKTEILDLSVNEMSSLEQISMHPSQCSFCNLRVLRVYKCADLTSIFTVNVASSLTKLERLTVSSCPVLESLLQEGENSEAKVIKFHKLKSLELDDLPMFVSLCDTDQVMELPQLVELTVWKLPNFTSMFSGNNEICGTREALLNKKIVIPNLEKLSIWWMEKLKEIWPCENITTITHEDVNNISNLREIKVEYCPVLVNIFACNWMRMRLVSDLAGVKNGEKQQPLSLFPNLTTIYLRKCKSIKYLFSPLLATHLSNLKDITITSCNGMEEVVSNRDDNEDEQMTAPTTTTLFPHLDSLYLWNLPSLKHVGGGGVAKGTNNDINDRPNLEGFFLGMSEFKWTSLNTLIITSQEGLHFAEEEESDYEEY